MFHTLIVWIFSVCTTVVWQLGAEKSGALDSFFKVFVDLVVRDDTCLITVGVDERIVSTGNDVFGSELNCKPKGDSDFK